MSLGIHHRKSVLDLWFARAEDKLLVVIVEVDGREGVLWVEPVLLLDHLDQPLRFCVLRVSTVAVFVVTGVSDTRSTHCWLRRSAHLCSWYKIDGREGVLWVEPVLLLDHLDQPLRFLVRDN